jgi:peptidoglycan/xylan/chitin deacetylase (PgdA/CDA1 family)
VEFLGTVERGERPSIDEHDQTYQVIRDLHPDIEDVSVEVPAGIALPYLAANANYKDAEAEKRCADNRVLADFMGSARRATWAGEQIAMRISKGGGVPFLQAVSHKASGQKVSAA